MSLSKTPLWLLVVATLAAQSAAATVTYEFRSTNSPTVIGTIEFAAPPANAMAAWQSSNPADLVSLFLDDSLFGLGSGNVLALVNDYLTYEVASLDGSELDFAAGIQDFTPGGAAGGVSDFFQLGFSSAPGQDVIESFANTNFVVGDWTLRVVVPLPAGVVLLASALGVAGLIRRRHA